MMIAIPRYHSSSAVASVKGTIVDFDEIPSAKRKVCKNGTSPPHIERAILHTNAASCLVFEVASANL
jgi:hypothetical protein